MSYVVQLVAQLIFVTGLSIHTPPPPLTAECPTQSPNQTFAIYHVHVLFPIGKAEERRGSV